MILIAGIDEAGRGPLVGPVVASAVILDPNKPISGLADSKTLTAKKREQLYSCIMEQALAVGIGEASASEIDQMNILQATFLAMERAVMALTRSPEALWIDGNQAPLALVKQFTVKTVIGGDKLVPAISAASIIAKVTRDRYLEQLDIHYPDYGFAQHKGYPTAKHLAQLRLLGPISEHRLSFRPVRASLPDKVLD